MLGQTTVQKLEERLRGRVIQPGDAGYDDARGLYNGMIDKRPRLIVQCADAGDVAAAVNFAREQKMDLAIRGGGHNGPGLGSVNDGMMIDLCAMRAVQVDAEARRVRVEGGCRWGDVDQAAQPFGLATVNGIIANTGVGGLTLGGGHGYLTRKYGLTVDNLLSAEVVLADGRQVRASSEENADLFWALRGGGGNFGVVTAFEFRLHPVSTVIAGPMFWALDHLEETMQWYREWQATASEDLYAFYTVAEVPSADPFPKAIWGKKICGLLWCCLGGEEEAQAALAEARGAAEPIFEHVGEMPFAALQSLFDPLYPKGMQWYWKGDIVKELTDAAIAEHKRFGTVPTAHSTMHLYPIDGAVHRVPASDTPWSYRDATWSMVIAGVDPDPAKREEITQWARGYWEALHPHSAGAAYINFMMEEGQDRIRATYGPNYERLQQVKAKYDPGNVFHVNQNVTPAKEMARGSGR
jgi:FAD/FMN-containing dehydrogenase